MSDKDIVELVKGDLSHIKTSQLHMAKDVSSLVTRQNDQATVIGNTVARQNEIASILSSTTAIVHIMKEDNKQKPARVGNYIAVGALIVSMIAIYFSRVPTPSYQNSIQGTTINSKQVPVVSK